MLDDLLKQIEGLLREGDDSKDGGKGGKNITVGNVGNNSTVVIVNGSNSHRRRKSDKPSRVAGDSERRSADQALHKEVEQLRYQVRALDRLVEHLLLKKGEPVVKRRLRGAAPILISTGTNPPMARMSQTKAPRASLARAAIRSPPGPAVSGFYHLPPPNST